jgi:hypothetical protein
MSTSVTIGAVVVGAAVVAAVGMSMPEIRRYVKIRSM